MAITAPYLTDAVTIPDAWRQATRADRLARLAAAMQRPDLAAQELMRASRLLAKAAEQMTTEQRERAVDALNEIRVSAVK